MALMTAQGTPLVFRQRGHVKSDFRRGHSLGTKDHLIHYKKTKQKPVGMYEDDYTAMTDKIFICEFSVKGLVYVTAQNARQTDAHWSRAQRV